MGQSAAVSVSDVAHRSMKIAPGGPTQPAARQHHQHRALSFYKWLIVTETSTQNIKQKLPAAGAAAASSRRVRPVGASSDASSSKSSSQLEKQAGGTFSSSSSLRRTPLADSFGDASSSKSSSQLEKQAGGTSSSSSLRRIPLADSSNYASSSKSSCQLKQLVSGTASSSHSSSVHPAGQSTATEAIERNMTSAFTGVGKSIEVREGSEQLTSEVSAAPRARATSDMSGSSEQLMGGAPSTPRMRANSKLSEITEQESRGDAGPVIGPARAITMAPDRARTGVMTAEPKSVLKKLRCLVVDDVASNRKMLMKVNK